MIEKLVINIAKNANRKAKVLGQIVFRSKDFKDLSINQQRIFEKIYKIIEELASKRNIPSNNLFKITQIFEIIKNKIGINEIKFSKIVTNSEKQEIEKNIEIIMEETN